MDRAKQELNKIVNNLTAAKQRGVAPKIKSHYSIVGNPGTGKTTFAQHLADLLIETGQADRNGKLVTLDASVLSGFQDRGPNELRTFLNENKGNVIFIDEAQGLSERSDAKAWAPELNQFAQDAMNGKHKTVFIVGGYQDDGSGRPSIDGANNSFFSIDPGFQRRFGNTIHMDDFTQDQRVELLQRNADEDGIRLEGFTPAQLKAAAGPVDPENNASSVANNLNDAINVMESVVTTPEYQNADPDEQRKMVSVLRPEHFGLGKGSKRVVA